MVACRTPEREFGGSKPTAAVLCPWARHFTPPKYWLITQEAMAPSRHDWKIDDWDLKPQHKQINVWLKVVLQLFEWKSLQLFCVASENLFWMKITSVVLCCFRKSFLNENHCSCFVLLQKIFFEWKSLQLFCVASENLFWMKITAVVLCCFRKSFLNENHFSCLVLLHSLIENGPRYRSTYKMMCVQYPHSLLSLRFGLYR